MKGEQTVCLGWRNHLFTPIKLVFPFNFLSHFQVLNYKSDYTFETFGSFCSCLFFYIVGLLDLNHPKSEQWPANLNQNFISLPLLFSKSLHSTVKIQKKIPCHLPFRSFSSDNTLFFDFDCARFSNKNTISSNMAFIFNRYSKVCIN